MALVRERKGAVKPEAIDPPKVNACLPCNFARLGVLITHTP
jgi:hypothetical protein